ncbi:MAG TPA: DUF3857 domain-containing protein [Acidobacteriaceae bacterium]|jgi:hypothetical protein|nr:DUF3857 domain-containing protein [Acidobacteriaceae bacterium]
MTSEPAAPGSEAVYLFRDETIDNAEHIHTVYARIKILNEKGREDFSDVIIPYEKGESSVKLVEGRTIHSDGSVVSFTGAAFDRLVRKSESETSMEKVFTLPDVQSGSIVEYRYVMRFDAWSELMPEWDLQQKIFVRRAHYNVSSGGGQILQFLPPGAKVIGGGMSGQYDLEVSNVPALPDEEDAPPKGNVSYRVVFTGWGWTDYLTWSDHVDHFASPSGPLKAAVAKIVDPADSEEQKLEKIYTAVMQLENTDFSRQHSEAENRDAGQKEKSAKDIWINQRGDSDEITLLLIALARAARLKIYAMVVVDRNLHLYDKNDKGMDQFDDLIAIAAIDGKEIYLDPGERYCEFGRLQWNHAGTEGWRQTAKGPVLAQTPEPQAADSAVVRTANLRLNADGTLAGSIRITMEGVEALRWRQRALRTDDEEAGKEFGDSLKSSLPKGTDVKVDSFRGLTSVAGPLEANLEVSGTAGSSTRGRVVVPGTFFEDGASPRFATPERETAVYLHSPYTILDQVEISVPSDFKAASLPHDVQLSMPGFADFGAKYRLDAGVYKYSRIERVAGIWCPVTGYPELRRFFQGMSAQDHEPVLFERTR